MAVAIVARKSTRDERQVSVSRQEKLGREWAEAVHPGAPVLVFSDNAVSGMKMDRPGWLGFTDAVRAGQVTAVWAFEQSRLTRAGAETWEQVCVMLTKAGIRELTTHTQGAVSVVEGSRLTGRMLAVFDLEERERARLRVKVALDEHAKAGRPHGYAGYGYLRAETEDGKRTLVPHPEHVAVVERMVAEIADGASLGAVAAGLNADGVPTLRGGKWLPGTVRSVVTSPRIVGQRSHTPQVEPGEQPETRLYPANWPAIVDRLTWERARARLATHRPGRTIDQRRRYLLTGGLAICDQCSTPLIAGTTPLHGQRLPSYQCPHPSRPDGGCGHCSILADRLEQHVVDTIAAWLEEPADLRPLLDTDASPPPIEELDAVEAHLADLAEQLARGDLLPVEHQAARAVLVERHRALSARIAAPPSEPLTMDTLRAGWQIDDVAVRRTVLRELAQPVRVASAFRDGHRLTIQERVHVTPRWA